MKTITTIYTVNFANRSIPIAVRMRTMTNGLGVTTVKDG